MAPSKGQESQKGKTSQAKEPPQVCGTRAKEKPEIEDGEVVFKIPLAEKLMCPYGCLTKEYVGLRRVASVMRHCKQVHGHEATKYTFVCRICEFTAEQKTIAAQRLVNEHVMLNHPEAAAEESEPQIPCPHPGCPDTFVNQRAVTHHFNKAHRRSDIKELCREVYPPDEFMYKEPFRGGNQSPESRGQRTPLKSVASDCPSQNTRSSAKCGPKCHEWSDILYRKTPPKSARKHLAIEEEDFSPELSQMAVVAPKKSTAVKNLSAAIQAKEESGIDMAFSAGSAAQAFEYSTYKIKRAEYECLVANDCTAWVNDQAIYSYLSEKLPSLNAKTIIVDPVVWSEFRYHENPFVACNPPSEPRDWELLVIPVYDGVNHWTIATCDRIDCVYFDSLRHKLSDEFRKKLSYILQYFGFTSTITEAKDHWYYRQRDGHSCGAAICMIAERIAAKQMPRFSQSEVTEWRLNAYAHFESMQPIWYPNGYPDENASEDDVVVCSPPPTQAVANSNAVTATVPLSPPAKTPAAVSDTESDKQAPDKLSPSASAKSGQQPLIALSPAAAIGRVFHNRRTRSGQQTQHPATHRKDASAARSQGQRGGKSPPPPASVPASQAVKGRNAHTKKTTVAAATHGGKAQARPPPPAVAQVPTAQAENARTKQTPAYGGKHKRKAKGKAPLAKSLTQVSLAQSQKETLQAKVHLHLMTLLMEAKTWEKFENVCKKLTTMLKALKLGKDPFSYDPKPPSASAKVRPKYQPKNGKEKLSTSELQKLYRSSKKAAIKTILENVAPSCDIPVRELEDFFQDLLSSKAEVDLEAFEGLVEKLDLEHLSRPFSKAEILQQFEKVKDTSPGSDGILYSELKRFDPDCELLLEIFQRCSTEKKVPTHWKKTSSVLLYKKGEQTDPTNWRPIALSNTIYKVYTGLWATRLSKINDLISPEQKGFCATDGTGEHTAVLRSIIHQSVNSRNELAIAWLDLSNAFGSVPHAVIKHALEQFGFPKRFRQIITDLYTDSTTAFKCESGVTAEIPIAAGVKQGDPISPILFNICMELVIRKFKEAFPQPLKMLELAVSILAFADDLVIVARTKAELDAMLAKICELLAAIGLKVNPAKCATLHVDQKKVQSTAFAIDGQEVKALSEQGSYEYLGVDLGKNKRSDIAEQADKAVKDVKIIEESNLAPWQKLDALKTFIVTRLIHVIRNGDPFITDLEELDRVVCIATKRICCLPDKGTPRDYLYGTLDKGGLGVLSLTDEYHLQSVTALSRLLYKGDQMVSPFFQELLTQTVGKWLRRPATKEEVTAFLNGDTSGEFNAAVSFCGGESHSMFTRLRRSMMQLRKFFKECEFSYAGEELVLKVELCDGSASTVLRLAERKKFYTKLRQLLSDNYIALLHSKKPSRGKVIAVAKDSLKSNRFLRTGVGITFSSWRFIHRARLNLFSLLGTAKVYHQRKGKGGDPSCRRCYHDYETLPHVLCHCMCQLPLAITNRHNGLQNKIVECMPKSKDLEVRVNKRCDPRITGKEDRSRADLVTIDRREKKVCIVDFNCPFDDKLQAGSDRKKQKYEEKAEMYRAKGFKVHLGAITIGALGSWCPDNDATLKELGFSESAIKKMAPYLIGEVIERSKDIFWTHILMDRYRPAKNIYNPNPVWISESQQSTF